MKLESCVPMFGEQEEKGIAKVTRFTISRLDAIRYNIGARRSGPLFNVQEGEYVSLHVGAELMMSDTPMERYSNMEFCHKVNGKVLVAGLGIGLIIQYALKQHGVTEIIVIEKHQDVIDLVAPKLENKKLKVICADINDWKPEKGEKFDTIYFDIWPDVCTDNLEEIKKLHNGFKYYLNRDNPHSYMNSWMKEYLQKIKRMESR